MRLKTLTNVVMLLLCGTQVFSQALNETVKDVCGNEYKVVQIGHQTWMAENFKCDKYDTHSRLAGQTISREKDNLHPYCVDSKELINGQPHFANMSEAQLNSLGLYYTWDAAVGAVPSDGVLWPTEEEPHEINDYSNLDKFDGEQGICPNGWHVPTEREFEELIAECGGLSSSAYKLRAKTGWNNLNNGYVYSTDQYGFNLLPDAIDSDMSELWSSTYNYIMFYWNMAGTFGTKDYTVTENPRPIRCVMNKDGNQTTNEKIRIDEIPHSGAVNEYADRYIDAEGGKISLDIFSNASWTVHSDADWVSASTYTGNNNQAVTLTIAPNTKNTADKTTVAFKTTNGTTALLYITRKASCPSKILYDKDLTDCMGNTYKTVKIGKQIWTANLFQCIKYDTESERVREAKAKGESTDIYLTIDHAFPTENLSPTYNGSPELAYTYNWAGALGIATESDTKNFTQPKSGHIQGICPNGWHIPTWQECDELRNALGGIDSYTIKPLLSCNGFDTDYGSASVTWTATPSNNTYAILYILDYALGVNYDKTIQVPIRCVKNEIEDTISITPKELVFEATGGAKTIIIRTNATWEAKASQQWVILGSQKGKDGPKTIQVAPNNSTATDHAVVTYKTQSGKTATVTITRKGKEKCNADEYPQVKIGNQIWMAENYRCSKYDTESEAYKNGMLTVPMIEKDKEYSNEELMAAYYADASDKTLWNQTDDKIKQLTNSEVEKFGYLYNWSATMGMTTDEAANANGPFHNRQGICPNGWHVPDESDWNRLFSYQYFPTSSLIPTHLKSETGWAKMYDGTDGNGINDTRFSILPAGSVDGNKTNRNVGYSAWFWTSDTKSSNSAKYMEFESGTYILKESNRKTSAKSVRCLKNEETLKVSPASKTIDTEGGNFNATVTSNTCWTAESDKEWATVSVANGCGDQTVKIQVEENETTMTDQAAIIFTTEGGTKTDTVTITRKGKEKCRADEYPQVKIGNQIWMAENYRCSKYDTESEAYKAGMLTVPMIEKDKEYSNEDRMAAYFIDATDMTSTPYTECYKIINPTDEETEKFGYAYTWAASMGMTASDANEATGHINNRQGICPNGWHVPSIDEWQTLIDYIEVNQGKGYGTAGKHLKAKYDWINTNYGKKHGLDTYGFAAMPANGFNSIFWSTTSNYIYKCCAYTISTDYASDSIENSDGATYKCGPHSVRCLKNEEVPADDSDVVSGPVIANVNSGASVPCKDIVINAKVTSTCKLKEVTLHYKDSKSEGGYQSVPMNGTDDDLYTGKIDAGVTVNGTVNYYIDAADTNGRHGIYGDISSPEHIDVNQTATASTQGAMKIEIGSGMTADCRPIDEGTRYRAYFKSVCNGSEFEWLAGESVWNSFHGKEILTVYGNTNGDTSLKNGFNEGEEIIIKAVNGDNQEYVLNGHGLTYSTVAKTKTLDRGNACSGQSQLEVSQYMVDFGECDNPKTVTLRLTAYGCEEISIKSVSLEKKERFSYFTIPEFEETTISCGETIEIPVTYVPTEDDENCLVIEYYERETPVSVTVALTGKSKRKSMCSGISINKGLLNTDGTLSGTLQVGNSTHIEMSLKSKCNKNAEELLNGVYDGTQGFSAAGKLSEGDYKITIYTNDKVCEYFFNVKK